MNHVRFDSSGEHEAREQRMRAFLESVGERSSLLLNKIVGLCDWKGRLTVTTRVPLKTCERELLALIWDEEFNEWEIEFEESSEDPVDTA